ncbi:hypothetical protein A2U01_0003432 [Trifolium medium]|uniref:Uncharacterized protein n=1 Tax=Trifolium medium TaxID=97028 RepID=A0A392M5P0_9FABA|nr:hypothetical protein [Trifolium medium]
MPSSTSFVSDATLASGPPRPLSSDSLVESMKALLKDDLDDLFLVPWMVDDFHEITRDLEKFDFPFIKFVEAANQKVRLALSDASSRYHSFSEELTAFEAELGLLMDDETKFESDIHEAEDKLFALPKKKRIN